VGFILYPLAMSVYKEIVEWSRTRPLFIRDALRRLLNRRELNELDLGELLGILKKEVGWFQDGVQAVPISEENIPVTTVQNKKYFKLLSLTNPSNINALYQDAKLEFSEQGLSIIFGNNGSGKSSYGRVLKKICWSRDKEVEIKPNVYTNDLSEQAVQLSYTDGAEPTEFNWKVSKGSPEGLNSIYVFDNKCVDIYVNNENPIEFRPIGIDLLESLVKVCGELEKKLDNESANLNAPKPSLGPKFANTKVSAWFSTLETLTEDQVLSGLEVSEVSRNRKFELLDILSISNPSNEIARLLQQIARFEIVKDELEAIEENLSSKRLIQLSEVKYTFNTRKNAYAFAKEGFNTSNPLNGVGSESWRLLWEAARKYANTEVHPALQQFPVATSLTTCVLCQQELSSDGQERLLRFEKFVADETSQLFRRSEKAIANELNRVNSISIRKTPTYNEIEENIPNFIETLALLESYVERIKNEVSSFLNAEDITSLSVVQNAPIASSLIKKRIDELYALVESNKTLDANRKRFQGELLELEAREYLAAERESILIYHREAVLKTFISQCKSRTNTRAISIKIGEVISSSAIDLQHEEFMKHLISLNPGIAHKVSIKKSKTQGGQTFLKCGFTNIQHSLSSILSEGEQKVIALANFLSECTIEGSKNSIVFDDPITSLDQDYREAVAKKVVELASDRQIIVLTHDLYFVRLLMDIHNAVLRKETSLFGLVEYRGITGIPTDEINYLSKNTQERIDNIKILVREVSELPVNRIEERESKLDSVRQRMRKLIERSVEEILVNQTIQRFSKNLNLKKSNLVNLVVVNKADMDFILSLFGKYSISEHDGGIETIPLQPDEAVILEDIKAFSIWRESFNIRVKKFKEDNFI
jgi:energy-coupling factor transporter ATP-binding protein EcfA2